jgi:hypothetical protein
MILCRNLKSQCANGIDYSKEQNRDDLKVRLSTYKNFVLSREKII